MTTYKMNDYQSEMLHGKVKNLFNGIRVSRKAINEIVKKWGDKSLKEIKKNPYQLTEFNGIGFLTADQLAQKNGYDKTGLPRLRAGLLHTLKDTTFMEGHTCLPTKTLMYRAAQILKVSDSFLVDTITSLEKDGLVIIENELVHLKAYYDNEKFIAGTLKTLLTATTSQGKPDYEGLAEDQKTALNKAIESNVFILTGAPGTGKTYTIKRIINSFPDAAIRLAAPTGKAAKRIYEQSGMGASTIHKLLDPSFDRDKRRFVFGRNADNPIEADLIILDETSMVDVNLMTSFLKAVEPGTRLVLVGDTYQLPSVGPGNILKDIIRSNTIPFTELTIIKRQDDDSGLIIRNCHRIKNGQNIELENSNRPDMFFLKRNSEKDIQATILELVMSRLPESYKADRLKDIQVITPLRSKTILSCKTLNEEFQKRMNKKPAIEKYWFKAGDKVIQTKNNYELEVINGDIGYVSSISKREREIVVKFESPERVIEFNMYDNDLDLAYALTCHKFQGSEARIVVIPIHRSFGGLIMQRNWIYTAVSRAKEVCLLVGQREEALKTIQRNKQQKRYTRLKDMLCAN